jgi:hypothetical protein
VLTDAPAGVQEVSGGETELQVAAAAARLPSDLGEALCRHLSPAALGCCRLTCRGWGRLVSSFLAGVRQGARADEAGAQAGGAWLAMGGRVIQTLDAA